MMRSFPRWRWLPSSPNISRTWGRGWRDLPSSWRPRSLWALTAPWTWSSTRTASPSQPAPGLTPFSASATSLSTSPDWGPRMPGPTSAGLSTCLARTEARRPSPSSHPLLWQPPLAWRSREPTFRRQSNPSSTRLPRREFWFFFLWNCLVQNLHDVIVTSFFFISFSDLTKQIFLCLFTLLFLLMIFLHLLQAAGRVAYSSPSPRCHQTWPSWPPSSRSTSWTSVMSRRASLTSPWTCSQAVMRMRPRLR